MDGRPVMVPDRVSRRREHPACRGSSRIFSAIHRRWALFPGMLCEAEESTEAFSRRRACPKAGLHQRLRVRASRTFWHPSQLFFSGFSPSCITTHGHILNQPPSKLNRKWQKRAAACLRTRFAAYRLPPLFSTAPATVSEYIQVTACYMLV